MSRTDAGRIDDQDDSVAFDDEVMASLRRFQADQGAKVALGSAQGPIELRKEPPARATRDAGQARAPHRVGGVLADAFIDLSTPVAMAGPQDPPRKACKIKGNRGVDTLLRNAYRAQLDMLALAATKANIMISLNGLLMSLVVLSGSHFLSINPLFAIPIALFFLGCATATVFAVLAARPDVSQRTFTLDDFESDTARLLVFEEFADLDERDYVDSMSRMLRSPTRVYRNMLSHVHELGRMADRKFQRLYYSYTVFMIGFVLAAASLVAVQVLAWFEPLA